MSGAINKNEILNIEGLDIDRKNVIETLKAVATAAVELSKTLGDTKGLKDLTSALKELNKVQAEFTKFQKQSVDMAIKAERIKQEEANTAIKTSNEKTNAIINENKATQAKIKTDKELLALEKMQEQQKSRNSKAIQAEEGSYDELNATLNQTIRQYKALSQADRENEAIGGQMIKSIQAQDAQLKQLDATMGRNQRNVGNYKSGFNGLNFSILQVGRELPSLAYGFSTFIGAISNNIPMVTDEITKARKELALLKEEGKVGVPIWKQLAGAVFSWQTAMVVSLTVLTMYGREIANWAKELFKGKIALDKNKIAQDRLNEANKKGYEDGQKDLVRLKLLYNATRSNTISLEEKQKAIKELQDQYPDYLGKFSEEEILAGKAGKAYYELANAIMASAKAKAYEQIIIENEVKKLELETKVLEERKGLLKAQDSLNKANKQFEAAAAIGTEEAMTGASSVISAAQSNVDKFTKSINVLNKEISAIEYSSKELADNIKPSDLLSNLGQGKSDKKNDQFTALEQLQDQHKKELEEIALYQQELLSNTELSESQILQAKVDNAKELIRVRIEQIDEEKKIATKEQASTLGIELAEQEKSLAKSTADFIASEQKRLNRELTEEEKRVAKERLEIRRKLTEDTISEASAEADAQILKLQEIAINEITEARGSKDKIAEIQHELTMNMIAEKVAEQDTILKTVGLEPKAYEQANQRKRQVLIQGKEEEIAWADRTEEEKKSLARETMQATNTLLQTGLSFAQSIYSAQAERAQQAYESETMAAGDSLEDQIKAKRKFEAEDKKIKRKQAVASKLQAVLDASLALALAIATTWKNPLLAALNISAASLGLGMALATPIPQYATGTKNSEDTFIAGEKKSEIIVTPDGNLMVTPNHATLYSDPKLKGSTVIPNPEVSNFLANLAMNNTRDIIDMSQTNKHLSSMEKSLKKKDSAPYINAKGKLVEKKGSITYIHS